MSRSVIKTWGLGKEYQVGERGPGYQTLRDTLSNYFKPGSSHVKISQEKIWAVKDVSFEVQQGEIIGIIGKNGAGKSTLLKVLSRITEPTEGKAQIHGRVGSLLEVGSGFHLELTGRENIFLNGAILGMSKREITGKFDAIVDFAEVSRFIDTPVKFYSSGMYVRLGFAVAAFMETEILLLDEVLAVGDVAFQKKCLGRIGDIAQSGRTIFFVSHNMAAIKNLCHRVLLFEQGRMVLDTHADEAVARYLEQHITEGAVADEAECAKNVVGKREVDVNLRYLEVAVLNKEGKPADHFFSDEPIDIAVTYQCLCPVADLWIAVQIVDEDNQPLLISNNVDEKKEFEFYKREAGIYRSLCRIEGNLLGEKQFYISVQLFSVTTERLRLNKILKFAVQFKGYNNIHDDLTKSVYFRPHCKWETRLIQK
ncbi:MAG: ABC transporter ATP-binding protein [Candidatus Omnitrophota bacterium]|nr:ABC transporter ATP-binding protein [Candidatus Omnitrophota bacterium]